MKKLLFILAAVLLAACSSEPQYATRAEKLLAEIHNPASDYVMVISHRGDWRNYPENSIPAIESVIRMGVDIVEIDVKRTKDGVLVLSHDQTINRMFNGPQMTLIGRDYHRFSYINEIKQMKLNFSRLRDLRCYAPRDVVP